MIFGYQNRKSKLDYTKWEFGIHGNYILGYPMDTRSMDTGVHGYWGPSFCILKIVIHSGARLGGARNLLDPWTLESDFN